MKNIPDKIYLQVGADCDADDFNDVYPGEDITWCADQINDNDIEYERVKLKATCYSCGGKTDNKITLCATCEKDIWPDRVGI